MPVSRRGAATTIAAAVVLFAGSTLGSYAANGGPLLLGKGNTASKTTKLKTTGTGAALKLKSKYGTAPLKVSNRTLIAKLNADLVDGLEGDALKTKTYVYDLTATDVSQSFVQFALPGLPPGKYIASYSVSVSVSGAATYVGCFLATGAAPAIELPVAAIGVLAGSWFVNGSGYVDTTTGAHRLSCQRSGGPDMTIPSNPAIPSTVVFTRVDDATTAASAGTGATAPRPFAP